MDSYFVRIYRRLENNPRLLVGVIEEVGGNGRKAFSNLYELWDILNPITKTKKRPGKSKTQRNNEI